MRALPDPPYRAALLAPSWLGDSVMATALLPELASLSGSQVEVWARPAYAELFAAHPSVGRVLSYEPKGRHAGLRGLLRWRSEVAAAPGRPDLALLVPDSISAALAARAAAARHRRGRDGEGRSLLLTSRLRRGRDRGRHWIDQQSDLLTLAGWQGGGRLSPSVEIPAAAERVAAAKLGELGLEARNTCAFIAGATYGRAKRWTGYAALARLLPPDMKILLPGAAGDREEIADLTEEIGAGRAVPLVSSLGLLELAALLRSLRFTVSNDTGPMHLAAAAGARVLGLFASTSPAWTAPRGRECMTLAADDLDCSPCFERSCRYGHYDCMGRIGAERVHAALRGWLEAEGAA